MIMVLPVIALLGIVVVLLVRASRHVGSEEDEARWSLRRFLTYSFLFASLVAGAVGATELLQSALPDGERLVGRKATEVALGLSLTLVAVPAWGILWRQARRNLLRQAEERASAAWLLYLAVAATVSLIVAVVNGVQVARWALGVADFSGGSLAASVVWAAVWGLHAWFLRDPALMPAHRLAGIVAVAGSAVGTIALTTGVGGILFAALGTAYASMAGTTIVGQPATETLRQSLAVAVVGALVWWWHWLRRSTGAMGGPRDTLWHAYVMLIPVLGGSLVVAGAVAVGLHSVLQWFVGVPVSARAAVHFEVLPGAVAAAVAGGWAWWYHRTVLEEASGRRRTEPERTYEYLVGGVGLVAAASGVAVAVMAAIQAVAPSPLAGADQRGRNALAVGMTLLLVGAPWWWAFWRRLQARIQAGDQAELSSPSRRAYLLLLFGATGLTAVISLVVILFTVFRDALEGDLAATALYELRAAVALTLTAGAVSGYHWLVHREDRAARSVEVTAAPRRSILLVSPDGPRLADQVGTRLGAGIASIRALHRVDVTPAPVDPETVAEAIRAVPGQRLVVIVEADGTVRVIPYDAG